MWGVLCGACVCVHACVRACVCVHACVCMREFVCAHACVCTCMCVHAHACVYVCACVRAPMHVCVQACVGMCSRSCLVISSAHFSIVPLSLLFPYFRRSLHNRSVSLLCKNIANTFPSFASAFLFFCHIKVFPPMYRIDCINLSNGLWFGAGVGRLSCISVKKSPVSSVSGRVSVLHLYVGFVQVPGLPMEST